MAFIKTCFYVFQISTADFFIRELSKTITCSWLIIWMRSIQDLSVNFTQPEFSVEKSATTSVLSWRRSLRTRRCCRRSAARPRISSTSSWMRWTRLLSSMSAITSPDVNVCFVLVVSVAFFLCCLFHWPYLTPFTTFCVRWQFVLKEDFTGLHIDICITFLHV